MATFYNRVVKNLDTSRIAAFQSTSDSTIVLSILVANTDGQSADVTIEQDSSADVLEAYLSKNIAVPSQSNLDAISNKFILPSGKKIALLSSASGSLDAIISYVEV